MSFWDKLKSEKIFEPDDLINAHSKKRYSVVVRALTIEESAKYLSSRVFKDSDSNRFEFQSDIDHLSIVENACTMIKNLSLEDGKQINSGADLVRAYRVAQKNNDAKVLTAFSDAIRSIFDAIVDFSEDSKKKLSSI